MEYITIPYLFTLYFIKQYIWLNCISHHIKKNVKLNIGLYVQNQLYTIYLV